MTNIEIYNKIFMETFGVTEDALNESFTFADTSVWDSVAHMSLVSALEDTFDIMLETEDILGFGSYLNGIEIMKRNGVEI